MPATLIIWWGTSSNAGAKVRIIAENTKFSSLIFYLLGAQASKLVVFEFFRARVLSA